VDQVVGPSAQPTLIDITSEVCENDDDDDLSAAFNEDDVGDVLTSTFVDDLSMTSLTDETSVTSLKGYDEAVLQVPSL
jgi:hypothetical protein